MRQVPHYLIIGNGNVARHIQRYFSLLSLSFSNWHRKETLEKLDQCIHQASHILLLISDHVIEEFIHQHLKNSKAMCIHFSGSLVSEIAYGAHPLMTFGRSLYKFKQYQNIPFILDHTAPPFETILPGLPNRHVFLHQSLKAKYHALCVLSGNFSCLLWEKLFATLEKEFCISHKLAYPYLLQQTKNLTAYPPSALTGPLARGDKKTIEKNLKALDDDPFHDIYKSFITCYQQLKSI